MEYYYRCCEETEGKMAHDKLLKSPEPAPAVRVFEGPIVVGAGPSGMAAAACLGERGVPCLVVERSDCVASLWQRKSYDRLRLHLPKSFCELPLMAFPESFPTYPNKEQFVSYLQSYARRFDIRPAFDEAVSSAAYNRDGGVWRVRTVGPPGTAREGEERVYESRWLVVATGENADAVVPEIDGLGSFVGGPVVHTSDYRTGEPFRGKKVLVVGCGNSGMEVSLDLCLHDARPSLVVRDKVHVLPKEIFGFSTFGLTTSLLRWIPVWYVDRLLLAAARLVLGDTAEIGLARPKIGPLELKATSGKTPVLDVGALGRIRSGDIKVCPGVARMTPRGAEFVDGTSEEFEAVVLATGYRSNVPKWLEEREFFSERDGMPRRPPPNGWKGENGLYAVGFGRRGVHGASDDARRMAEDVAWRYRAAAAEAAGDEEGGGLATLRLQYCSK